MHLVRNPYKYNISFSFRSSGCFVSFASIDICVFIIPTHPNAELLHVCTGCDGLQKVALNLRIVPAALAHLRLVLASMIWRRRQY